MELTCEEMLKCDQPGMRVLSLATISFKDTAVKRRCAGHLYSCPLIVLVPHSRALVSQWVPLVFG